MEPVPGELHVANNVIADIVGYTALQCYGVVSMTAPSVYDGISKIFPSSRLRRGILIDQTQDGLRVDLYIVVEYGTNINIVSQNLKEQVAFVLKELVTTKIDTIGVHVEGLKVRK